MKKFLVILMVLGLAGVANAAFWDDFDSNVGGSAYVWAEDDLVPGSNNWVSVYWDGTSTAITSCDIGAAGTDGVGTTKGIDYSGGYTAAGRDISGDVVGGVYRVTLMADMPVTTGGVIELHVRGAAFTAGTGTDTYVGYGATINESGHINFATMTAGADNEVYDANDSVWSPNTVGWVNMIIDIDYGASTAVFTLNDVNDDTGAYVSQLYTESFPGTMPFASAAGILTAGWYGTAMNADNFDSTPEPVTLSILAIGAGLALLRRRRA